jgi:Fis family transcriptional regulator
MAVTRSASRSRRESVARAGVNVHVNGHAHAAGASIARQVPLRNHTADAITAYFASLNGHRPSRLYQLVMREVEEPLFRTVMDYTEGNQVRAASILGINRGTLRKKLREYGLAD